MKKNFALLAIVAIVTLTGLYIKDEWPNHFPPSSDDMATSDESHSSTATEEPTSTDALGVAIFALSGAQ